MMSSKINRVRDDAFKFLNIALSKSAISFLQHKSFIKREIVIFSVNTSCSKYVTKSFASRVRSRIVFFEIYDLQLSHIRQIS